MLVLLLSGCATFQPYRDGKAAAFTANDGWSVQIRRGLALRKEF